MGLFVGRAARFDHEAIAAQMRPALERTFNAWIELLDPNLDTPSGRFDPYADTGGSGPATLVYDSGENGALIQPIRSPVAIQQGDQTTHVLGIRFQVKQPDTAIVLRAGLRVRVRHGGNARYLERYTYTINEGFDTSLAWDRIIEASTATTGVL